MKHPDSFTADLQKLVVPISDEKPSGESVRYTGTYDRIRQARREDDPGLEQGIWKTELKRADWGAVRDLCLKALETQSKDLQLACWLLEAWLHIHGFAGVREGLRLCLDICENFWDTLYPELDGDDLEARVSPIEWINEKLAVQVKRLPITRPATPDSVSYSWADWASALWLENAARKDAHLMAQAVADGKVTQAQFVSSAMLSPKSFHLALSEDVDEALKACAKLDQLLDEKCGKSAPSLVQFNQALASVQGLLADILKGREDEPLAPIPAAAELTEARPGGAEPGEHGTAGAAEIHSRAEAYRMLSDAANYLLRTEPHSPAPYLVRRAIEWGSMGLKEVLQEVIENQQERNGIYKLLNMEGRE